MTRYDELCEAVDGIIFARIDPNTGDINIVVDRLLDRIQPNEPRWEVLMRALYHANGRDNEELRRNIDDK